ncbi:DHA2 family efflux MFS transporter permease subunit [Pseudonocardia acaciae]|uniref:DHA2 family efflux MFS transporter permease subunit n=1 Tax=Pseudonocardia acaciae TaxID=551276 RepID=UPI000684768D|nr:DHA2 family efflux MFS transporter permease subunit [Pseudonocardia acaciae]
MPPLTAGRAEGTTRAGVVIGVLVVSAFVMFLNETILSVALRGLSVELDVSTATVQWLTSGFLLTMAVVIPTTGFLLERYTPRTVFLTSMGLFCAGTLTGALAPGFAVLLLGRVAQAGGTALMLPLLATTVMRLVARERRGAMMGTVAIVVAFAPALGPTVGGAVLAYLGWRWMFLAVLPLAVAALVAGAVTIRVRSQTRSVPLDVPSVLLSALGFGGILYGLSSIPESGGRVLAWIPIAGGIVVLVLFVLRQLSLRRDERALLDPRPFTNRRFVVALLVSVLLFMCHIGVGSVLLPIYLQTVLHQGTFVTGLAVLPGGLVLASLGIPTGRLFDRYGARPLLIPGTAAMAVSLWVFAALGEGTSLGAVIGVHIVLMTGIGLMMTPLMTEPLAALPGGLYSHGTAILGTSQQMAGALGTAVFVTVASLGAANPAGTPDAAGMRLAFGAAGIIGALAVLCSLCTRPRRTDRS